MEREAVPVFAVVGHPNKGKSSIVSTLAEDESVRVSAEPGTTTAADRFALELDGRVLYELVDTPGFQRARRALDWMRDRETTSAQRREGVAAFVAAHRGGELHRDEVALLEPILGGAAILYVVDGSTPFGPQFEAEMEVLRWTGRPSMALINPIGEADHVAAWRASLEQYFRVVRVFDAMEAEFDKRVDLLRAFGQLDETWRGPMDAAVEALVAEDRRRRRRSVELIADLVIEAMTHRESVKLKQDEDAARRRPGLETAYREHLRQAERRCRSQVESLYRHERVDRREDELALIDEDLFGEGTWSAFGLSRSDMMRLGFIGGGVAGAAGGATVDLATLGLSHGAMAVLGGATGAIGGAAAGWFAMDRLAKARVMNQPLGGRLLTYGPTENVNLAFVLLGRAIAHHHAVARRSHAQRGALTVEKPSDWQGETKRRLAKAIDAVRKKRSDTYEARTGLIEAISRAMGGR
jgi:predicted GTPase